MKLFVIINPNAKRNKKRADVPARLERIFGADAEIRLTNNLEELDAAARDALAGETDVLGICGGDGTIHHTLTHFYRVYGERRLPKILLLGGGTMNMVCHSLGVHGPSEGIAHRYMEAKAKSTRLQLSRRDTISVDGRLCFIFGLGLVSNFLNAYYAGGDTGPLKAALVVQRAVVSVMKRSEFSRRLFAPWSGRVTLGGRLMPFTEYTALLAQTIENLGIGFKPMYRAFERPRHFHVIGTRMSAVRLVNQLPNIFLGRTLRNRETFDEVADSLVVTPDNGVLYTMDGDMYTADHPLTIGIGPQLEFFVV